MDTQLHNHYGLSFSVSSDAVIRFPMNYFVPTIVRLFTRIRVAGVQIVSLS